MPSENDYADYLNEADNEWEMYNYHFNGSYEYPGRTIPTLEGLEAVMANLLLVLFYPTILVTSGILFFMICKNKKTRGEPWRWLIAHTCLCIFFTTFIMFVNSFTTVYHLPSFKTSAICPATKILEALFWQMFPISFTLVATERFRAIKSDDSKTGGMGKKSVISSLVIFWILNILVHVVNFVIPRDYPILSYYDIIPFKMCQLRNTMVTSLMMLVISTWSALTAIVVFIGSSIIACRKADKELKKFAIAPTLITTATYFFFYFGVYIVQIVTHEIRHHYYIDSKLFIFMHMLVPITWIVFCLTWIISWSKSGDASCRNLCPCCPGKSDEEIQLLERKE